MYLIRRTKGLAGDPMRAPAVHYAVTVDGRGLVTLWTADPATAVRFSEDVALLAGEFYGRRPAAGRVEFLPAAGG
jgi:hypothetical protein